MSILRWEHRFFKIRGYLFMSTAWIILAVLAGVLIIVIGIYNSLVQAKNLALEGWSGIDVQLKRRADLIPNLVEAVKGYMGHEKTVLEDVTAFRAKAMQAADPTTRAQAEGALT